MNAMIGFLKDALRIPKHWVVWLMLLVVLNMIAPFFFWSSVEAKVVLAVMTVNAALMVGLHARFGFVRLLGVGHVLWLPLLPWLFFRLCGIPAGPLSIWLWSLIVIDGISLAIDVADVVRYARGERAPTIPIQQGGESHGP